MVPDYIVTLGVNLGGHLEGMDERFESRTIIGIGCRFTIQPDPHNLRIVE
jgi:hypothetical protein